MFRWFTTTLGIRTKPIKGEYADERKRDEVSKIRFNDHVCACWRDLYGFWRAIDPAPGLKCLVLDAHLLGTTTRLHQDCGVELKDIDVVSRDVAFAKGTPPNFYTGELQEFLKNKPVATTGEAKYDMVVFDLMGSWPGKDNDERRCLELLFEKQLLEDVAILEMTLSFRNGNHPMAYMHQLLFEVVRDVQSIAQRHGYMVQITHFFTRGGAMFYLFFKVIHPARSMAEEGGIEGTTDKFYASHWWTQPIASFTEVAEPQKKKRKRSRRNDKRK